MCFWLSTRTMKLGMFTTCLPTLQHRTAQVVFLAQRDDVSGPRWHNMSCHI